MDRGPGKKTIASLVFHLFAAVILTCSFAASGQSKTEAKESEAKEISGISIVGNNEVPKSLYIVPWKSSEIGVENSLSSSLLNDTMAPVDREVFMRELDFFELTQTD